MNTTTKNQIDTAKQLIVREYELGGTKFVVKAKIKDGAVEDAKTKVRRLIRKEISKKAEN